MPEPTLPSWWSEAAAKRRQNARSAKMEARVAREVGGRTMAGSGSSWRARGDVSSDDQLIQHKYTDAKSFVLKLADWQQCVKDARNAGKDPAMIIEFASNGKRLLVTEIEG